MAVSFEEIFNRYQKANIGALSSTAVNRRESANTFARLAEKGSIGAALTAGLLMAESDKAASDQKRIDTLAALAKYREDIKRSEAEIARLNANTNVVEKTGVRSAEAKIANTEANTNVVEKTGVRSAEANIAATESSSRIAQQRADTEDFYKRESIRIQSERDKVIEDQANRKISVSEADQRLRELKTRSDIFLDIKNLDISQQKLYLEQQVSLGKLSLEGKRTIEETLNSQSVRNSRSIADEGVKKRNEFIGAEKIAGIRATLSGANVNNQSAAGKEIDNRTRDDKNKTLIDQTKSVIKTQGDNRVINRFNTKQTAINNAITSRIQQERYKNEEERQLYSLIDKKYNILGTKESIDKQIRDNMKKEDEGIFSFVSKFGEKIFGVSDKEEAKRKAKRVELDYLLNRRKLFEDF